MASLRIFNSFSRQKEPFTPANPERVGLYVCGPTVYSFVHIGNARTFTSFDVVVRYLRYRGFGVIYIRNFTDVDDKIIRAAQQSAEAPLALAARFVAAFEEDAKALKLLEPDVSPKVSEHIPEIHRIISTLIQKGIAYRAGADVYFSVSRYPQYAELSRRSLEDLQEGERAQTFEQKRDPLDFALWKGAKPGEVSWPSPWSPGRPGWHIECSAMSGKYLGPSFDIHGGGIDLVFPHHENELAQSQAASGQKLARYWMHCGFLDLAGAKMSKSLGNVVRLRDALEKVDPEALRYFFISTQYRNPLSFTDKSLSDSEARLEYFYETLQKAQLRVGGAAPEAGGVHGDPTEHARAFEEAMDDDFNTAGALAALSGLFSVLNELIDKPKVKDKTLVSRTVASLHAEALRLGAVLGLFTDVPAEWLERRRSRAVKERGIDRARVEALIAERQKARKEKRFREADAARDALKALGVEVMDTAGGTSWKVLPL